MRTFAWAFLAIVALAGAPRASITAATDTRFPCRQPQLAADGQDVFLACGNAQGAVLIARSANGTFGPLVTVAETGGLALGNHRGPRIAVAKTSVVVSAIVSRKGAAPGGSGNVTVWRSDDRGQTWSAPFVVNDVPDAAREGLHAMAADGNRVVLAWLDLRDGPMRLMSAVSTDGGRTWEQDRLAYASAHAICTCCHPSVIVKGTLVIAMFRNDHEGARDMFVVESRDGGVSWDSGRKIGTGTWPLKVCPMDGGAIALDARGGIVASWRREDTIYVGGHGHERAVGTGVNPAMALADSTAVVVWNGQGGLLAQWGDSRPTMLDAKGRFAAVTAAGQQIVAAYEVGEESVIRRLAAPAQTSSRVE